MDCTRCNTHNEERAQFCKNCGMSLSIQPIAATSPASANNIDVVVLLIYTGWHFLTYIIYAIASKLFMKAGASMMGFYKAADWVFSAIDVILLITMIAVFKNNAAKICAGVFLLVKILLVLVYKFS